MNASPDRSTIAAAFDPRRNSLNFLRLVLAAGVVFSHAIQLGGFGDDRAERFVGHATVGDISVDSFFAISGFLITRSALTNTAPRYLWQRFLRIYPGYWGCLVVTATVVAPLAWLHQHGELGAFIHTRLTPAHYVLANAPILGRWGVLTIGGGPTGVPFPGTWNGSLWTLPCELECYLLVCALFVSRVLRNRRLVLLMTAALYVAAWLRFLRTGAINLPAYDLEFRLVPIFASGALVALWSDRLPDSGWIAVASLVAIAVGVNLRDPHLLTGPALAYLTIWLGMHLPLHRVGARTDISYGVYIYAWPLQTLLAVLGVHRAGYVAYVALTFAILMPMSVASWFVIEKPALSMKKWTPRLVSRRVESSLPAGPSGSE